MGVFCFSMWASWSIESMVSLFLCECRVVGGCVQECDLCML